MNLRRKQELYFDAIEHSLKFLRLTYCRLETGLLSDNQPSPDYAVMDALVLDCWIVVDVLKRLRTLIYNTPGLKRSPKVELFLSRTSDILQFRDYVQHLEEKAQDVSETGMPIWGTISWVRILSEKEFAIKMYAPGRAAVCKGIPVVNPAGRDFHGELDHIELSVNRQTVNISDFCRRAHEFAKAFEASVGTAEKSGLRDDNGIYKFSLEENG